MRILHIDTGAEMRGGQHQVLLLMKALQEAGHAQLLIGRRGSPLAEAAESAGFRVILGGLAAVRAQSQNVEIVHAHDARAHLLAAAASARKFVVSRRVAFPVKRSLASQWKYRKAARYLAVSQQVSLVLQAAGIQTAKIDVVYDAVPTPDSLAGWNSTGPVVALSSADPMKGRDLVERVAGRATRPFVFSSDLTADLPKASLFLYITRSEGLGSAALLAMAYGVPVIASNVGGLPEIVEDQTTGLLAENDEESIGQAIGKIFDEPALAERLRVNAFAAIKARFSPEQMAAQTVASYGRALES